jgi:hypothetical protein
MKSIRILRSVCCSFAFAFCALATTGQVRECTEAEQKEAILTNARDWKTFYREFKRLAHCDDGAMAENFSENVVTLLAKDWKHIGDLGGLIASDGIFRRFVLNHIDATANPDDLRIIISNSRGRCPETARQLCRSIDSEAKAALKEQTGFSK